MSRESLLTSRNWPSTSKWGAAELLLLHVDNRKCPGELLLEPEWADYHDDTLSTLLSEVPCDVSEFVEMLRPEISNGIRRTRDFESKFQTHFGSFYENMADVICSNNNRMESQSALNVPLEDVLALVVQRGSAVPLRSDSDSSDDTTSGLVGSPRISRSVRFVSSEMVEDSQPERPIQDSQSTPPPHNPQFKIPKSSSMKSVTSNLSDEMGTTEDQTESAVFELLHGVVGSLESLGILRGHTRSVIKIGSVEGPISINDGQITLNRNVTKSNKTPLVNIECKSRSGSSGPDILSKLYSQEFGECLAIVQKRLEASKNQFKARFASMLDVYSIGAHGRRAYLLRASFSEEYLDRLDAGDLEDSRVVVTRSDRSYRLDKADELKEFITLIYRLCMQLQSEIAAGRRY